MSTQLSEIEGQKVLNTLARRTKATAALSGVSTPPTFVLTLILAISILIGLYLPKYVTAPDLTGYLVSIVILGFSSMTIELWTVRRRLEGAIELLKLRDLET